MTIDHNQLIKDNFEILQGIKEIQESVDTLIGVPSKLEGVHETTKAIMADLVLSRKEHTDATTRLTDALIKLANRVALGLFIIVLLCLAGFFGRNLVLNAGKYTSSFTQLEQGKPQ